MKKIFAALAVILVSGLTIGSFVSTQQLALAANFTASNVSIDSEDGTMTEVTVAPSGTIQWSNFDSTPPSITVDVYVSKGPNNKNHLIKCATETIQIPPENRGKNGSQGFSLDTVDLTSNGSLKWSDSNFKCGTDGGNKTVSGIKVKIKVTLPHGETAETNDSSFDVTVNNLGSSTSVSGSANTGGSA